MRSLTRSAAYDILRTRSISIPTSRPRAPSFSPPPPARRNFEHAPPEPQTGPTADKNKNKNNPNHKRIEHRPTNRQIPFKHVFVLDPETNKLSPTKQSLEALLAETRATKQEQGQGQGQGRIIELVTSTPEPIVRVTTRSEVEARYREMKKALRKGLRVGEEPKEVQLTWGVAKADLEHKLRKTMRDLEKGYRVIVVVTMKNKHRPSNQQELVAFADGISETLCEVGEEWKERKFTERLMVLSFRKTTPTDDIP